MKNADKPMYPQSENWQYYMEKHLANPQYDHPSLEGIGLTKREYFAAMAMQGLLSNYIYHGHYGNSKNIPMVAEIAVQQADELLKQLDQ